MVGYTILEVFFIVISTLFIVTPLLWLTHPNNCEWLSFKISGNYWYYRESFKRDKWYWHH